MIRSAFNDVTCNANGDQREENADVRWAACETADAAPAPHKKHYAAGDERNAKRIHHDFIDAEVHALVEHRVARLATQQVGQQMLDRDQRRADEQHDKAAEQQDVCQACRSAAPDAPLQQHVANQPANGQFPIDTRAIPPPLPPQANPAHHAVNPKRNRDCASR